MSPQSPDSFDCQREIVSPTCVSVHADWQVPFPGSWGRSEGQPVATPHQGKRAGAGVRLDTARFFGKEELARQLLQRMKPNRMRLEAIPTFQTVSLA